MHFVSSPSFFPVQVRHASLHFLYIIPDVFHEQKIFRIFGNGYPLLSFGRNLVYWTKLIRYGRFKYIFSKARVKFSGKKLTES